MTLSERIKQIRQHRGLKQFNVAAEMQVTQQAYSLLEQKGGNYKIQTLIRFCTVVNVDLSFLFATEIPVTDENMKEFDLLNYTQVFEEYKKLKGKSIVYEELILRGNQIGISAA
jgi:transcriptional regulator with XRE-family HTH domain